ncbi:MAG: hypothetical protein MRK00_04250 [Nitrosomonas sp.]|nr:hypothetical protein [Nitrosomonas sp.]
MKFSHVFNKFTFVILGALLFGYPLIAIAELEGSQRFRVKKGTYNTCMASTSQSTPNLANSERKKWCICYADQVVSNTKPDDIKNFSINGASSPTPRMRKIASNAIDFCRKKTLPNQTIKR